MSDKNFDRKNTNRKSEHGVSDVLEVIGLIIKDNPGLMERINVIAEEAKTRMEMKRRNGVKGL